MMKLGTFRSSALMLAGSIAATAALAQIADNAPVQSGLDIPANLEFLNNDDPFVRKATAIVNGYVITGTDLDQRLALVVFSNGSAFPPDQLQRVRAQVLRNLIDETLQIQAAESEEIKVEQRDIDNYYAQYAQSFKRTPKEFSAYLKTIGSSEASIKRQIHGEIAWRRLQSRRIEPFVNVAQEEVQAIIDRLNTNKGQQEYNVSEIFLSGTAETQAQTLANANEIVERIHQGFPFAVAAQQTSEASTRAVGGDLSWVRAEQLPEPLSGVVTQLPVGQVSNPIPVPGGYSILLVKDSRRVLVADERDALLSLKQVSIRFPAGTSQEAATPLVEQLVRTVSSMGGCGGAEAAAAKIKAEVTTNDQVVVRDLPGALQDMLLKLSIGQATPPFGSVQDRVSVLVLCGRDDPAPVTEAPSAERIHAQLSEQRVNQRANRYLRDLRRDAVIDYR
jgi:peptidyl-prolyl cis-trans isomerase SurA